ncbi:Transcription and mRNA export factor eny2 [Aphanomyces cochlioides]|nr:Transcription and mRNA export factor eny2 [Aphanomyces cochlioides]
MRAYCKDLIKTKGIDQITVDDLVEEITPKGRATVPDSIKADMLERIRLFLETTS